MKNVIMLIALFLILGSTALTAQTAQPELRKAEKENVEQATMEERTEIKAEKLPASAIATLNTDKFEGWIVEKVYKVKRGERKAYEVTLTNGVDIVTAWFDENGNLRG